MSLWHKERERISYSAWECLSLFFPSSYGWLTFPSHVLSLGNIETGSNWKLLNVTDVEGRSQVLC